MVFADPNNYPNCEFLAHKKLIFYEVALLTP